MESEDHQKLTWEMLAKSREDLAADEKELVDQHHAIVDERRNRLDKANQQLRESCKMVTSGPEKDLIPAYGWTTPVTEMVYAVEALNILYKKHRVRAVFDQVKEKYADFRGYHSVEVDDTMLYKILMWPLKTLQRVLSKVEYKVKNTESVVAHDEETWLEHDPSSTSSSRATIEVDGKTLEKHIVHINTLWTVAPTKHKLLYHLSKAIDKITVWQSAKLDFLNTLSKEDEVIRERLDTQVEELVSECEKKCRHHCIQCGRWLDDNYNCYTTNGWITYVCKTCGELSRGGLGACSDLVAERKVREQKKFEAHLAAAIEKISNKPLETPKQLLEELKSLAPSGDDDEDEEFEP